jgi:hypothetical protein
MTDVFAHARTAFFCSTLKKTVRARNRFVGANIDANAADPIILLEYLDGGCLQDAMAANLTMELEPFCNGIGAVLSFKPT